MITYFSTQIKTNKNTKELNESLNSLLWSIDDLYIPFYPFCLFTADYYRQLRKGIKTPYFGEISKNEFTLKRYIRANGIKKLKIVGKITTENEKTIIHLKFQQNIVFLIAYLILIIYCIWAYFTKEELYIILLPFFLLNEYAIVFYHYLRIKKRINKG